MKTKRYFNQILKPYKTIIKDITGNYTDIRVTIGEKFCCFCREDYDLEIEIPVFEDISGSKAFNEKMQRRLKEYGIQEQYSNEILSFLHEIGHIYTYSKFNDFMYIRMTNLIQKIQAIFCNSEKVTNWMYQKYFNLALEKNADKWAMEYIKEHPEQVKEWEQAIAKNYIKILPKLVNNLNILDWISD